MLATLATLATLTACRSSTPAVSVHHDSPARTVFLRTGAVDLPGPDSAAYDAYHAHAAATPLTRFAWPVDGWPAASGSVSPIATGTKSLAVACTTWCWSIWGGEI